MKKFFQSGGLFLTVAVLCFASAVIMFVAQTASVNIAGMALGIGMFWLTIGAIVRSRYQQRTPPAE